MSATPARAAATWPRALQVAAAGLAAVAGWSLAWELVLDPLRPGGSWLALKAIPAAACLCVLLRHGPTAQPALRALQSATLLLPLYAAEAAVRLAEPAPPLSAAIGLLLALGADVAAIAVLHPYKRAADLRRRRVRAAADAPPAGGPGGHAPPAA